jgi:hypothetical protein
MEGSGSSSQFIFSKSLITEKFQNEASQDCKLAASLMNLSGLAFA